MLCHLPIVHGNDNVREIKGNNFGVAQSQQLRRSFALLQVVIVFHDYF
jgi:hypothetical protein